MKLFTIRKILPDGSLKIEYTGSLRERNRDYISIDTGWSRDPLDLGYVVFERDDRWVETFYFDRWYNVFRISDRSGKLKGIYINVTKPPLIEDGVIEWVDLAIDIWIRPDGSYLVLDEDEFEKLDIDGHTRQMGLSALEEVKEIMSSGKDAIFKLGG